MHDAWGLPRQNVQRQEWGRGWDVLPLFIYGREKEPVHKGLVGLFWNVHLHVFSVCVHTHVHVYMYGVNIL